MMTRLSLVSTLLLVACGDNHQPVDVTADANPEPAPAFAVGTRVWDDSSTTSFFNVVDSLAAGTTVDTSKAVEVAGAAKLFSLGTLGWFAIGGGEAPTIRRYELDANNVLKPRETIDLANHGVESLWDTVYVISPTKAYYPDRDNRQLIVWNPTAMTITGTIQLPQTERAGFLALYGYTPVLRGDQLLFTVGWFDWTTNDAVRAETGLVVIDTTTDTVARFDVDTRCGGITTGVEVANGDVYFASSALAAAAFKLGRLASKPCVLRVKAGETALDAAFHVELDALAGGLAGEPVSGGANRVFLRTFDEASAQIPPEPATWDVTGQLAWKWLAWDVASNTTSEIASLPASTADVVWFEVDGKTYGAQTTADYASTTLIDLSAATPTTALTAPGFVHGVARIR